MLTKQYVWGEGIDECVKANLPDAADIDGDSNTSEKVDLYYHHNSLGSVVAVTDLNGVVKESYRYTAFGKPTIFDENGAEVATSQVEQPFMFTGARYDFEEGSGLYQMRHRYYDPVAGRFVSRDPLGLWGDPSQNGIGQGYCGHNPVNRLDPLGDWSPSFDQGPSMGEGSGFSGVTGQTPEAYRSWMTQPDNAFGNRLMLLGYYHYLPRAFIHHYATGHGETVVLTEQDMVEVNAERLDVTRSDEFLDQLEALRARGGGTADFTGESLSGARTDGTLGRFTVRWRGRLRVAPDGSWAFEGEMSFSDRWNFEPRDDRALTAEILTWIGRQCLTGEPFDIESVWVRVTQTSEDDRTNWGQSHPPKRVRSNLGLEAEGDLDEG